MTAGCPFFELSINELRGILAKRGQKISKLGQMRRGLELRYSQGARPLLKEVTAVIRGDIKLPKPENQWPERQSELPLEEP